MQQAEIVEAFAATTELLPSDTANVDELIRLAKLHNLTAESLHNLWESFSMQLEQQQQGSSTTKISHDTLTDFRMYLQTHQAAQRRKSKGASADGKKKSKLMAFGGGSSSNSKTYNKQSFEKDFLGGKMEAKTPRVGPSKRVDFAAETQGDKESSISDNKATPSRDLFGTPMRLLSGDSMPQTPLSVGKSPMSQKFTLRNNSGKVEITYNAALSSAKDVYLQDLSAPRVEIAVEPEYLTSEYRFMYDKTVEQSRVVDSNIDALGQLIAEENKYSDEVANPRHASQSLLMTYGRICSDSEARLNQSSLMLETSRHVGLGSRVTVNVESVDVFSLFPGQIVGVQGVNNMGRDQFLASKIFSPSAPESASTSMSDLYTFNFGSNRLGGKPMKIMAACGPYTLEDNFSFEPLDSLIESLESDVPDILILSGPFVDEDHPLLISGQSSATPKEIFQKIFVARILTVLQQYPHLQVLLVPSTRDVFMPWCVLPQPPIPRSDIIGDSKKPRGVSNSPHSRIVSLPNPCVVSVNEVLIGISSTDILFHLSSQEIAKHANISVSPDRVACLTRHLLQQRNFYPLSPGHEIEGQVDSSQHKGLELNLTPDVLILPSKLATFAKNVDGCLVVNPGNLCRQQSAGTYARFVLQPISEGDFPASARVANAESDEEMYHGVAARTKVEVVRV